ncbi:NADH:flavin oxidoreductase [Desulfovibrio sp. JC010]|uniref:NADH:flavin oxidoreductase n=1 Tax=Desulfovibrio sp. JC010 TaxID=2593641 RepID=UPI0013D63512|nr:NADH:flavin oxidoreductase [Desulfovibrio sp. JC010]
MTRRKAMKVMAAGAVAASVTATMQPTFALAKRNIFEPVTIGNLKIKNRIFKAATSYDLSDHHGRPSQDWIDTYVEAAEGGPGMMVTDVTYVEFDDRPSHADLSIHDDSQIPAFKKAVDAIHKAGSKVCMQLGWAGSMTITGYRIKEREVWGPSKVQHPLTKVTPTKAISKEEIKHVVKTMADGALRAKKAGFDAIELHFCHNFMLSQFLTPYYNKRTDEYGGPIENRARLHFEITEAVRKAVGPDYPVLAKIHGRDYLEKNGMTIDEGLFFAKGLEKRGVTALEISGGNLVNGFDTMPWRGDLEDEPQNQTYFAADARKYSKTVKLPLILTGGNRRMEIMEKELNTNPHIVAFGLCRTLLSEPDLVNKWKEAPETHAQCVACNECIANYGQGPTVCVLN